MNTPNLILVGASVRAAAQSALGAGITPWCIDLFADADLKQLVPVAQRCAIADYPHGFLPILANAPKVPVAYTGGIENSPFFVSQLARDRVIWGNDASVLSKVRDPIYWNGVLRRAGFPTPALALETAMMNPSARWLRKPLQGTGGQGISFTTTVPTDRTVFVQEYIAGPPHSAVCIGLGEQSRFLGITQQLIGTEWLNAKPFQYAGNIGPCDLPATAQAVVEQLARCIATQMNVRGLFGFDFILVGTTPVVVEINPRYPASVEVLERASNLRAFAWHQVAFCSTQLPEGHSFRGVMAKGILYATRQLLITPELSQRLLDTPDLADIPNRGEVIESGWPILTMFAASDSPVDAGNRLRARTTEVRALLGL